MDATVAGWGSFHDTKCTTNHHSPSENERCVFPFKEQQSVQGGEKSRNKAVTYTSCTYAANPSTHIPVCKEFYKHVHTLNPFPRFPIILEIENKTSIVCQNNTHGKFGWCRTNNNKDEELPEAENSSNDVNGIAGKTDNWGWCRKHCLKTDVMMRSRKSGKAKKNEMGETENEDNSR